ncbi:MAG TPA: hypothetical protein VFG31_02750 [Conexibacter sp.]|nr:hypothetical protein [Conexibacter sp.]
MSERDFVDRLGDELTAAARRQAQRRAAGWRRVLPASLARRAHGRALVLVGAVALVGAGGTAGLLAARGEVGGPPSLTFARISPQQRAAGVKPLTRPVVVARGRLAYDGRPWQLVGFQTTRGLCIEIDFPRQERAGGCGSPNPRGGEGLDWQAQIAVARGARGLVLGAVDPAAATVAVRHGAWRTVRDRATGIDVPLPHRPLVRAQLTRARVIHVRERRLLAALGLRRSFAYWLAELDGSFQGMRVAARDARGDLLGRAGVPYQMNDTSRGIQFRSRMCGGRGFAGAVPTRAVSTLPPPAVRARIAALRRPQRASDLPPRWFVDSQLRGPFHATIEVDAIRLLRRAPNGDGLYLVPTTELVPDMTPSPGCLRTLSPHQREREAMLQRRARALARRLHLTVYALGRRGGGTAAGFDLDAYRRGRALYGSIGRQLTGMAPDGVARVELRLRDGSRRVVPVVGNVWTARLDGPWLRPSNRPRAIIWLDGQGNVLRRLR